jgi:hypothetical protein
MQLPVLKMFSTTWIGIHSSALWADTVYPRLLFYFVGKGGGQHFFVSSRAAYRQGLQNIVRKLQQPKQFVLEFKFFEQIMCVCFGSSCVHHLNIFIVACSMIYFTLGRGMSPKPLSQMSV